MGMGKQGAASLFAVILASALVGLKAGGNFYEECDATWEPQNCWAYDDGNRLSLALVSNSSGSMIRSKKQFIYGTVSTMIQLVPGDSAGTVTTYYTSSLGDNHDEIDYEFLGNVTGQPYTIHTNVYADGVGNKEMQFKPWFDPTADYHNYTISWAPCMIVWYIDGVPIRAFRNYEASHGVAFPTSQPMYAYSSIWAAEDWATQGGRVKADWSKAPFVASYHGIDLDVCECYGGGCVAGCAAGFGGSGRYCSLSAAGLGKMQWVQSNYRIYDYCADPKRWINGQKPVECDLAQY
ncbi:putative xyloglucan endotransglucosylase/hydrolase protein 12 [Panicum miliaceum]|uniref:Xyloglucan endotransglucosylase/hydrolase n=1 Tax=Panicum miliaceum TaxID=4540 RepID=A0A3L6RR32_PANMI|nr:putative xyloglucan endotransglucosylase/hydrolase protein 12 [Panicum miliaceum]